MPTAEKCSYVIRWTIQGQNDKVKIRRGVVPLDGDFRYIAQQESRGWVKEDWKTQKTQAGVCVWRVEGARWIKIIFKKHIVVAMNT